MGKKEESEGCYLVYLFSVESNSATFGVDTWCVPSEVADIKMSPAGEPDCCCQKLTQRKAKEIRRPSLVNPDKLNDVLDRFDRGGKVIDSWKKFYRWLGCDAGQGWALFTPQSAAELVPHWLCPGANYECIPSSDGRGFFVDKWLCPDLCSISQSILDSQVGNAPEDDAGFYQMQLGSNMVITRQQISV